MKTVKWPWGNRVITKKTYYVLAAMSALVFMVAGAWIWKGQAVPKHAAEEAMLVRTAVLGEGEMLESNVYAGEVRGRYESQLAFQASGKITKRFVQLGSRVQAGEALMQLDPKDLQQSVNSATAQTEAAQAQLRLAESNVQRYRQLFAGNAISRAQLDQYENAYAVAQAAVRQASAQQAQGTNQLEYSLLVADQAGIISAINAEQGQVVSAGQVVLTLVQEGEREVEINVPENRIEEFRKTSRLQVSFWALPGSTVEGEVRELAPMADAITRTFKVRVRLLNPPEAVKLGMTASVATAAPTASNLQIPLAAIYQTGKQAAVFVVAQDRLHLRQIEVGSFGAGSVQVLSGLHAGERIVIAGVHQLQDGQLVRIQGGAL